MSADDRRLARVLGFLALSGPVICFLIGLFLRSTVAPSGLVLATFSRATSRDGWVSELLELHNRMRAMEGLPPLSIEDRLGAAAQAHAQDMAARGVMEHRGGDGSNPADRVTRLGYRFAAVGENVAMGQTTPGEAAQSWYNSPPHRRNILGDYSQCGVGRSVGADGRFYWCIAFGSPR